MMKDAWDFGPKSWWERLKSSPLGAVGGILAIVVFPIAIGVGIYNAVDNMERKDVTKEIMAMRNIDNPDKSQENHDSWGAMAKLSEGKEPKPFTVEEGLNEDEEDVLITEQTSHPGLSMVTNLQTTGPLVAPSQVQTTTEKVDSDLTP